VPTRPAHRFQAPSAALAIRYVDPKEADDTPQEAQRYDERCMQIAREMLYTMTLVKAIQA
jgi:hypothetical protein